MRQKILTLLTKKSINIVLKAIILKIYVDHIYITIYFCHLHVIEIDLILL